MAASNMREVKVTVGLERPEFLEDYVTKLSEEYKAFTINRGLGVWEGEVEYNATFSLVSNNAECMDFARSIRDLACGFYKEDAIFVTLDGFTDVNAFLMFEGRSEVL